MLGFQICERCSLCWRAGIIVCYGGLDPGLRRDDGDFFEGVAFGFWSVSRLRLNVKPKMHDVAIFDDVVLAFQTHFAGFF